MTCDCVPHKHRDLIIAWANGARIQMRVIGAYPEWHDTANPAWNTEREYRIKPEVKFDKIRYTWVEPHMTWPGEPAGANIRLTFDHDDNLKRAEVIK